MNGIGINSLKNMPKIESLQIVSKRFLYTFYQLELNDNKIEGGDFNEFVSLYPNLYKLKVVNNQISSLDIFKSLQKSNIKKIYLKKNPCSENKNYISEVFKLIPELACVDSMSNEGEQVDSTIYDEEDEENDVGEDDEEFEEDDDKDDEEFNEESEEDEDEDDDNEEEEGNPKQKKKH